MGLGTVRIGISGWQYDNWRGDFYPAGLPRRSQLTYVAEHMPTVELNGSFYSLQRPASYRRWHDETPDGFVFAIKGGRYITHLRRLRDVETALANYFASGVLELGTKLGPILWQLPARLTFEPDVLDSFLHLLPRTSTDAVDLAAHHDDKVPQVSLDDPGGHRPLRHALEVRSTTFDDERFFALLRKHDVACVLSDSAGRWVQLDATTAGFEYVRLHGHSTLYASRYASSTLRRIADRCRTAAEESRDVYVYFDNDMRGHAPHDALRLARMVGIEHQPDGYLTSS